MTIESYRRYTKLLGAITAMIGIFLLVSCSGSAKTPQTAVEITPTPICSLSDIASGGWQLVAGECVRASEAINQNAAISSSTSASAPSEVASASSATPTVVPARQVPENNAVTTKSFTPSAYCPDITTPVDHLCSGALFETGGDADWACLQRGDDWFCLGHVDATEPKV